MLKIWSSILPVGWFLIFPALVLSGMLGDAAPELRIKAWVQGGPHTLRGGQAKLMWFKRNGHFAKNEISESEVSNEYSKNQTEFHPRVQG